MKRVALGIVAGLMLMPVQGARAIDFNNDSGGLQVFDTNIENLQSNQLNGTPYPGYTGTQGANTCYPAGVFHPEPAVFLMALQAKVPDIVIVQQLDGKDPGPQLDALKASLMNTFHTNYNGIVANTNPAPYSDPSSTQPPYCQNKYKQTNAIIYRTDRLNYIEGSKVGNSDFRSLGRPPYQTNSDCAQLNGQARTENLYAAFTDKGSWNKRVNVVSYHWPAGAPECSDENAARLATFPQGYPQGSLTILGGDGNVNTNYSTSTNPAWYLGLAWRYYAAAANNGSNVDFLWARKSPSVAATWRSGTAGIGGYGSNHPGVVGFVEY